MGEVQILLDLIRNFITLNTLGNGVAPGLECRAQWLQATGITLKVAE